MSRLKDKKFEILAVSCDDERKALTNVVQSLNPPGIHTWHEKGPASPVAQLYNIQGYPTWYLIDPEGVIRARDPFGDALIPAVEGALKPARVGAKAADSASGSTH